MDADCISNHLLYSRGQNLLVNFMVYQEQRKGSYSQEKAEDHNIDENKPCLGRLLFGLFGVLNLKFVVKIQAIVRRVFIIGADFSHKCIFGKTVYI